MDFNSIKSIDELHEKSISEMPVGSNSFTLSEEEETPFTLGEMHSSNVERDLGEDYSVKNLASHKGFVGLADRYLDQRYGSSRERGETNEDVIEEYLTHYRYMSNNTIDLMQEVDFLRQTDSQTKDNFQILHNIYEDTPNFMSEGGGGVISGIGDVLGSVLTDPATVVGLGFGGPIGSILAQATKQAGKGATTRMILKTALKGNLTKIGGMTSIEGLLGSMHESQRQEMLIEAEMLGKKDVGDIVTSGVLTGGLSLVGYPLAARGLANTIGKKIPHSRMDRIAAMRKAEAGPNRPAPVGREETLDLLGTSGLTSAKFDVQAAELIRNRIAPGSDLLDSKTTVEITKLTNRAALEMQKGMMQSLDPKVRKAFAQGKDEQNSDFIFRIINQADEIDSEVVERAVFKQGLTLTEFTQLHRLTAREAGQTLASFRKMGNKLESMVNENPDLQKQLDEIYGKKSDSRGAMTTIHDILQRADRETRAMMVSQIATTARNVLSGAAYLSFGTAAKLLEGTMYGVGKSLQAVAPGGRMSVQGTTEGIGTIVKDATSTVFNVLNTKDSQVLANLMLESTPKLHGTLFRSLQETGNETLSKTTRWMNGLNMAQDVVLRSGVFTDSVNVRMAKVGLDMEEYIGKNKDIPMEILKAAIDDSLEATFARTPKSLVLRKFVELVERLPFAPIIGTFTFPFARFTADALAFQVSYSPANFFSSAGAGYRWGKANWNAKKMTDPEAKKEWLRAAQANKEDAAIRLSQGAVGSAVLYGAMKYREDHPELKWYEVMHEGKPVDIRAIFPASPYLAVADIIQNLNNKAPDEVFGKIMEGMTGSQLRGANIAGSVGDFFEAVRDLDGDDVSAEKLGEMFGNWTGSITGRILTPAAVVRDAVAVFDSSEAIVRSTRIAEGEGFGEKFGSAFSNNLKAKMPVLQKDLPEYQSPTKKGKVYRQSPFATQLTGIKSSEQRSKVETELASLGIEPFQLIAGVGNRQGDYLMDKHAPPYVNAILGAVISTPFYRGLPIYQKRKVIKKRMTVARKMIKGLADGEASMDALRNNKTYSVMDKGAWSKLPATQRQMANEYFEKYYGSSVSELGAFKAGVQIGRALEKAL